MAWMPSLPSLGTDIAPTDDATAQLLLKRKLAMADALKQQEMPQGQMVSGHYVAPSWTQYLGNLANKWVGGEQEREAVKGYQDYQKTQNQKLGALLEDLNKGKAVTEQGTYDIQVPNGQTPTSTDNLGGMQPYESGMKNISVPMTTTTGYTPYTQQEFMSKVGQVMPELMPKFLEAEFARYSKDKTPIKGAPGERFFDPVTHKEIFAVPEKTKEEKIFGTVNPGDFTPTSLARFAQTGGKDYSVLVPIPKNTGDNKPPSGYRWGPNGTLEAIKGGPADKPLKSAPPTALHAYQGNNQSLSNIDAALKALDDAPDEYFGLQGGLGDTYMQRRYPKSTDVRSKVFGVGAVKRHDISGAAISATEAPELRPFIPSASDTKPAIKAKLESMRSEIARNNAVIEGMYGDTDTYAPLPKVPLNDGWSAREK